MSPFGATTMPPGVLRYGRNRRTVHRVAGSPMTSRTEIAASRSMNVPVPMPTIMTTKISALRRLYARSRDGEMIGAHDGPIGIATMLCARATRSMARRTIAVVCAVRQTTRAIRTSADSAVAAPASGQRSVNPAAAASSSPDAEADGSDDAERRRPQMRADAQKRAAAAVFFGERPDVDPAPAADDTR